MLENMYKKILIATDGSEPSKEAEDHGLMLAKRCGASVTALYVEEINIPTAMVGDYLFFVEEQIEELEKAGKKIVEDVVKKGEKMGVTVTPLLVKGHAAHEIIEHAKDYDIVVMGTIGRSGLSYLLTGSVAEKVVRHASVPVLVVRT